jgi:carboxymethylenebutenolidase
MAIQDLRIPRDGGDVGSILAEPEGRDPVPGVVMIPTVRGLEKFARYVVERLAADGFVALGVNIFDHPGVPENPRERPGAQPDAEILGDLEAALSFLQSHPRVGTQPIFAWGYCLGGRFALLWPTYQPKLAGAVSFHGFPTNDTSDPNTPTEPAGRLQHLAVPILAFFGAVDVAVPMSEVERYREAIAKAGTTLVEIEVHPGANHGWTDPFGDRYQEQVAEHGWRRGIEFMRQRSEALRGATV